MSTRGLSFQKVDLHIHSPASDDYRDKSVTGKQIVEAALSKGLRAIAISDHQTGNGIDAVMAAAKGTALVVFPGVEVTAAGGKGGIHVLCIFDVDKSAAHVNQFLNTLKIYDHGGTVTLCTEATVGQVADELDRYDCNAIMILAHCHSTKGVLGDTTGPQRSAIFEKQRRCLVGAETNENNFTDAKKIEDRTRVFDILGGTDPGYHYAKLGIIQGSDAHEPNEIGRAFSWLKVDEQLRIEDLRQCLIDRDTRIRQPHEYKPSAFPSVRALCVTGGFLDGAVLTFNDGLNSILGGKGTGKSLVVELLRFGLDQGPAEPPLANDHEQKLLNCLKTYGKVAITISDETGKEYLVTREYKPNDGNPTTVTDIHDETPKAFAIRDIFPCIFLSQNEAIQIAQDVTGRAQRQFIDRFFDFNRIQQEIQRTNRELQQADRKFAECVRAKFESELVDKQLAGIREEIEKIDRQVKNEAFDEYAKKERVGRAIDTQHSFIKQLGRHLSELKGTLADLNVPLDDDHATATDPIVRRLRDVSQESLRKLIEQLNASSAALALAEQAVSKETAEYRNSVAPVKQLYEELVKQAGGNQVTLNERRKKLILQRTQLESKMGDLQNKHAQLRTIADNRKAHLAQLDSLHTEYSTMRRQRCEHFSSNSNGALDVSIMEAQDTADFQGNLMRLKKGSWLREDEISVITKGIIPKDFVRAILGYAWKHRNAPEAVKEVADKTGLAADRIEKLFSHFLDECTYEELLALEYTSTPDDVPQIKYRVDGQYKLLGELSVGQKSVALLIMALSDGRNPIIIDQPEDSLDLRSIWDDVCSKVRSTKEQRQFIFSTHNSSVAIASDSDCFSILVADGMRGRVAYSGSINASEIRKEVLLYLEGGTDTYNHKRRKYNIV